MKRHKLINILVDRYSYKSYLELESDDKNFEAVELTNKTGVNENTGDIRCSSDFFLKICQKKYDIILINAGPHTSTCFESALKHLNNDGCIILHGCLPEADTGDEWKVVADIRRRDGLDSFVIDADSGLAIIFKRPNTAKLTNIPTSWENYSSRRDEMLRIVPIDEIINLLPPTTNPRNIWISCIPEWGRIGHQFNDIITGPIIAEIFGFNYHYTGFVNQENLNYYLNFADLFDVRDNENPLYEISTPNNDAKWRGLSFELVRKMMRSIPSDTNVVFRRSTFFNLRHLYPFEQAFVTLPGIYKKQILRWRSLAKETNLFKEITPDFVSKPGVLNVATYVRGGGSLHDNAGRAVSKDAYDHVVRQIQADYPDHELNVVYYSQGPHNDLIGFANENIMICDNTYPRMYEVIRTFLSADVFIAGLSGFSTMISILRDGPNYFLRRNPWALPEFSRIVD